MPSKGEIVDDIVIENKSKYNISPNVLSHYQYQPQCHRSTINWASSNKNYFFFYFFKDQMTPNAIQLAL